MHPAFLERLQIPAPARNESLKIRAILYRRESLRVRQKSSVVVHLPLVGMQPAKSARHRQSGLHRFERRTIDEGDIDASAALALELAGLGRELDWNEAYS